MPESTHEHFEDLTPPEQARISTDIAELTRDLYATERPPRPPTAKNEQLKDIPFQDSHALIALDTHTRVAGVLMANETNPSVIQIHRLAIAPDFRKRHLSQLLMREFATMALSHPEKWTSLTFQMSDQQDRELAHYKSMADDRVKQLSPFTPVMWDEQNPALGGVNLAQFECEWQIVLDVAERNKKALDTLKRELRLIVKIPQTDQT